MEDIPKVELERYSGPMDLLLDLVKKEEMDICSIDICKITNSYMDHLKRTGHPDLEKTGNFIRLASTLLLIKSRILLPVMEEEEEDGEDPDKLKDNFVRLLKEYQQCQTAGKIIYGRPLLGRDIWSAARNFVSDAPVIKEELVIDQDQAPFLFIQSYGRVLEKIKRIKPHIPATPIPTLAIRIRELSGHLIKGAQNVFSRLVQLKKGEHSVLLTFLSLLELSKQGFVSLIQSSRFADIDIMTKKNIDSASFQILDREEQQEASDSPGRTEKPVN